MVRFTDPKDPASEELITRTESRCGVKFPEGLRWLFQHANGARPDPFVLRTKTGATAVNDTLALADKRGSAVWFWEQLQKDRGLRPGLFPFAIDPGGNLFLADCDTPDARVFFMHHDEGLAEPLVSLDLGLQEFWERLEPE